MNKIPKSKIHIGDIVQLKAASESYGETFPHMVVIEVVKEKIDGFARFKYHCVWFIRSRKEWAFKYTWLTSVALEEPKKTCILPLLKPKIGDILFLSSIQFESNKTKDANGKVEKKATIHGPPVLTIIGFESPKNKAPIFDSNSNVIRETPSLLVKCLYYNPISNKYSEIILPIESLFQFS